VPDCLKAFAANQPVQLRFPGAVRPWQHVLEPLSGYLRLAEALLNGESGQAASAWNFGPDARGDATVGQLAQRLAAQWGPGARVEMPESGNHPHEASQLRLDITRARTELGWQPRWSLDDALAHTVAWHRAWWAGDDMAAASRAQIAAYGVAL
jgi:CDP-glucose 4,6-dehydratase